MQPFHRHSGSALAATIDSTGRRSDLVHRPRSAGQVSGSPAAGEPVHPHQYKVNRVPASKLSCFVVEDNAIIRQNLIATLEEMLPLQVVGTAEDEQDAKQWMASPGAACQLMLIDIFLKSGTGLEVLRSARALMPDTRLVVLTNYATLDMRRRCAQLGADRVFDKSSELEELLGYCQQLVAPPMH